MPKAPPRGPPLLWPESEAQESSPSDKVVWQVMVSPETERSWATWMDLSEREKMILERARLVGEDWVVTWRTEDNPPCPTHCVDLRGMIQINQVTKTRRPVRRLQDIGPSLPCGDIVVRDSSKQEPAQSSVDELD